ncbi:MAG: 3-hydroxyacyl-CoA dehydrogenase NAD-binding domain-containing protein [Steroidobacteraceae bacterium]
MNASASARPIRTAAIVGTGAIGASWATCFLAHGLDVVCTDPSAGAEERLRAQVARQWSGAEAFGLASGASRTRLRFTSNLAEAVAAADFVQENGPEKLDLKRTLFAAMDEAAAPHVVLASSSSGIVASTFQDACRHPERVLIGHPFNPPHIIPLIEVVGGTRTSIDAIETAMAFYTAMGRRPIHIRKETKGFVTNRLQAALWREAYGLVHAGVASAADIDAAISNGPGLRWALKGPFATQHLSGGTGGLQHVLEHLGAPMDDYWQDLFPTRLTDEVKQAVLASAREETSKWNLEAVTRERDALLVELLKLKATGGGA